jgi:coenzyme F420-0:L-glutamate ligase/coenzyme F420-1:gamma-L-glutamate ligase
MAVVDELAAAGELVKGKCDQVPVAVVRGYLERPTVDDGPGAAPLVRSADSDLFSLGTAEARAEGLRAAATLTDGHGFTDPTRPPVAPADDPDRAVEAALARALGVVRLSATRDGDRIVVPAPPADRPDELVRFGADLHRLRAALAADGVATTLRLELDAAPRQAVLET